MHRFAGVAFQIFVSVPDIWYRYMPMCHRTRGSSIGPPPPPQVRRGAAGRRPQVPGMLPVCAARQRAAQLRRHLRRMAAAGPFASRRNERGVAAQRDPVGRRPIDEQVQAATVCRLYAGSRRVRQPWLRDNVAFWSHCLARHSDPCPLYHFGSASEQTRSRAG